MLFAYFDDSNTHADAKTVTMAGYIARLDGWQLFEQQSEDLFKRDTISKFHAKEFNNRSGDFRGFSLQKQLRFATEWLDIAGQTVLCGYSRSILKEDYLQAKRDTKLAQSTSPYGYCFKIILKSMCSNGALWKTMDKEGIHIVIEHGNVWNEGIEVDYKQTIAQHEPLSAAIRSMSFVQKSSCRAIQLADYLAYYAGRDIEIHGRSLAVRDRPYLDIALQRVPTDFKYCTDFYRNPDF